MGISMDRAFSLQSELLRRAAAIHSQAISFKMASEDISREVRERLYNSSEWKRAPRWVHSYVEGYMQARRENIYRHHMMWMLWLDGRLLTSKEVGVITELENRTQFQDLVEKCEESVRLYKKHGGSCRHPPTWEEFNSNVSKFFPSTYKSPWSRIDGDKSRHVWTDEQGNPLPDRPYDRKWREVP